jgi:signal transduction histidine kinase
LETRVKDLHKAMETLKTEGAETPLRETNEMRLLDQLTSGVAHEVRNPLNGIMAIMGALSKELSGNDRFQPYMQHMRNQVTRLTTLMEALLLLGRPLREENMQVISMATLVDNTLSTWLQTLQAPRPAVKFEKPDHPEQCLIRADAASITQLIINLLENAYYHTPKGAEIVCTVHCQVADTVILRVKDGGSGISKEILPRIFDPFFTTRKGGTGLGLSIVRHIAEIHQGSVFACNNTDGPGATFQIVLPLSVRK